MSDEVKDQDGQEPVVTPPADPMAEVRRMNQELQQSLLNLKSEMNRKIEALKPTPPPEPVRPLQETLYDNPELAIEQITSSIESRLTSKLEERENSKALAAKIYSDYPELEDPNNPLTQRANEIYTALSPTERKDPKALKSAVLEAAAEMALAPKSKRKTTQSSDSDSFSLGSKGSGKRPVKKEEVTDNMLQTAALMGLDVKDPKVVERLRARTKRSYGNYGE
jgi:hypothetical protein